MTCGIYCIENNINGNKYIGQSVNIETRFEKHKYELNNNNHHNQHLQRAWNKYHADNFSFFIVKICKYEYLDRFEKFYIRHYNTISQGYNITYGYQGRKSIKNQQRLNMSISTNTSGIYGISKRKRPDLSQGFIFVYKTVKAEKPITSMNLRTLESKIKKRNLDWIIIDENKAKNLYTLNDNIHGDNHG